MANQFICLPVTSFYNVTRQHVDYVHDVIFFNVHQMLSIVDARIYGAATSKYLDIPQERCLKYVVMFKHEQLFSFKDVVWVADHRLLKEKTSVYISRAFGVLVTCSIQKGIVYPQASPPVVSYLFKHLCGKPLHNYFKDQCASFIPVR